MSYALADLYERAGDLPRARDLFGRVATPTPTSSTSRPGSAPFAEEPSG